MATLPFRVSSDPRAHEVLAAFGPGNATLGISLSLVEPGTNRWIFDDEHIAAWLGGQPDDASWVAPGQDSTVAAIDKLWLYGPPGCGRTLLAATLVDHLIQRLQSEPQHAVCYHFAGDGPIEQEAVVCLKALIAQLAQQSEEAYRDFTQAVTYGGRPSVHGFSDAIVRSFDAEHPTDLGQLLETMSRRFAQVSVVVKGVDMMSADLAVQLAAMVDAPGATMKTIFTSGDGSGQQNMCMETVSCPVEAAPAREEVRLHLRNEMKRRIERGENYLELDSLRKEIERYILHDNHSWLWAVTALDDQCDLVRRGLWTPLPKSINADGDSRKSKTPPDFDPYLERIMRDSDPMPKFILTRTAHWLAMTENEPSFFLTSDEHVKALTAMYRIENEEFRSSERTIQTEDVIHACRPIIRQVDTAGISIFQFKHETVYGYLLRLPPTSGALKEVGYDGYTMGREFRDFLRICDALPDIDVVCADSLYKKLLSIHQKLFGNHDSYTLLIQDHYASFCWEQGRLEEAERLYLDIVSGFERIPPENRDTQYDVFNNLGIMYKRQNRYEEAEHYYHAALRGREAQHGPAHESTLHTVSNIAQMYAAQGRASTAQTHWAKALPLCEETFGHRHPKTISIVYNLGLTHKSLGQYDAAEAMLSRALSEHDEVYGPENWDTIDVVTSLAHLHLMRGNDLAAESLYQRALASYEKRQGPTGENVLHTCHSLAKVYHSLDRMQEAEVIGKRAFRGFEATAGPDSIDATDVAYTLFLGYIEEGRLNEAIELGERVISGFEKDHGGREGITATVADNMALAHAKLGQFAEAESLWRRAYDGHVEARGEKDELSLAVVNNLGLLFMRQGRHEDAESWLRRALQGYEELQGPGGETTMRIARDLSGVYRDLGNMEESDAMASRGYRQ